MALTKPTLYAVSSFDATTAYVFQFNVIGGDQVVKNKLTIKNNSTNVTVYEQTQTTFTFTHTVAADSLTNGVTYNAQVTTYNASDEASSASAQIIFTCYTQPTFAFNNIPSGNIIGNSSYTFGVTYSQLQSEALSEYEFNLYDTSNRLLSTSGIKYTASTTVPISISYTFGGLTNNSSYKIECIGTTIGGTSITTDVTTFAVSYFNPVGYTTLQLSNSCEGGYVTIQSNATSILGTSEPSPPIYISGTEVDLSSSGSYVKWDDGYQLTEDWTLSIWGRNFTNDSILCQLKNDDGYIITLQWAADSTNRYIMLTATDNVLSYVTLSNSISAPLTTDKILIWVRRIDNIYSIVLTNLNL